MVSQLYPVLLYFGAMVSFHQMDSKIQNKEFVPPESTVNVEFYKNILDRLCKIIAHVRPALWKHRSFFCCMTTLQHTPR